MRTLNIRLAVILMVATIVLGVGVYFLHGHQIYRNAYVFKDAAKRAQERVAAAAKAKDFDAEQDAFKEAVKNFFWYVRLVPEDVDTVEELGTMMADRSDAMLKKNMADTRLFLQARELLERVLRQAPERTKVRRRLVDMAIMSHRSSDAKDHLKDFLLKEDPKNPELWELLGRCNAETAEFEQAVENFKTAIGHSETQVESYALLAGVLRYQFGNPRDIREANQWMQKLVDANPQSARAHFLRGRYLKDIAFEKDVEEDVDALDEALKAVELAPDDRDCLWLAAQCYKTKKEFDKAREYANRAIKLKSDDIDLYTTLADIELGAGNTDKAVAALEQGLKATHRSSRLLWNTGNLLINANRLKEADKVIAELRTTDSAKQLIDYLVARVEFAQGHWLAARQGFDSIRGMLTTWPDLKKQADVWIGHCYGQLGDRDQQVQAYRRALDVDPLYVLARQGIADALMASGKYEDAAKQLGELKKLNKLTPNKLVPMARAILLQVLRKPPAERVWEPAEQAIDEAEKANPGDVQIPLMRSDILAAKNRLDDAIDLLKKALANNPKQLPLCVAVLSLTERQKDWSKTESLLEEYQKLFGDVVELRLAEAQLLVRRDGQKAADRLRKLAENTDRFTDAERVRLWTGLLTAAVQVNDPQQAKLLCQRIAEKEPQNVQVQYMLFEQALRSPDDPTKLKALEEALNGIEKVAGQNAYWYCGKAVVLTLQADSQKDPTQSLEEALRLLSKAKEISPSWSRVRLLTGRIYDRQGQTDLALKEFQEAFEMGDRNPEAVRRSVQILYEKQQFTAADTLLKLLQGEQTVVSPDMERVSAEVALEQGDSDRALELAKKSAAADSKDYREQVWLGQMLSVIGHRTKTDGRTKEAEELLAKAEKALRRAVELEPKVPATWVALVQFLGVDGNEEEAAKVIREAGEKIPVKEAPLALAQCYEAVKKTDAAAEKYAAALEAAPQDPTVVRSVADFYYRTGKPGLAENQLQRIVEGKVKARNADIAWARRQLAAICAARGGYQNLQKARSLIEENLATTEASVLDQRLKAFLNASDPKPSLRNEGIRIFEKMIQEKNASADDRFQLAIMYLKAGEWGKANTTLLNLVTSYPDESRYLSTYVAALLEHGATSTADEYLTRLEKAYPNHFGTVGLRAQMMVAKNEPDKAFDALKDFLDAANAQPPERTVRVRLVAERLEDLARKLSKQADTASSERFTREAESLYRMYVDQNSGQEFELVAFLGRQGRIGEALDLLTRTWDSDDPVVLTQLCALFLNNNTLAPEQLQRLGVILQKALTHFDRPVPLMMVTADLYMRQARYADAENLYREVLQKSSGNANAMNNLAVLLALQGVKVDESLQLINQAIELAGPVGAMLDSRATVYLAKGEPDKALADLADALVDAETPVRLFHQAQALEQGGRRDAAASAMEKAQKKGLTKEMVQPLEVPTFEKLMNLPP